ncbi:MAG: hypothetical protein ACRDP5_23680 [Streptosporangiaceae bacterium]
MRARFHKHGARSRVLLGLLSAVALLFGIAWTSGVPAIASTTSASKYVPASQGELDCNGFSPAQKPLRAFNCTDIRGIPGKGNSNSWDGRFYDNGHYIGHDEPDVNFNSSAPGSGNNVTWTINLGKDPKAAPTDVSPGHDVSDWFELSPAPWFSMALCDPNSYPLTACTPESDSNAPTCHTAQCVTGAGGGSAFMEMQFYPPGNAPFIDSESCDATHWCAALTIDSAECDAGFQFCNTNCEEPLNFAFIQRNGVPTGPPSPQDADAASEVPNNQTLLMNPGDTVTFHMWDAPLPGGGGNAFEVFMDDQTTHQTGVMQASADNGFMTSSPADCSGTPFNFQPEYNTAKPANINPWGADQVDVSTEFETGHWEACTSLSDQVSPNPIDANDMSPDFNQCSGPYENAGPPEGNTPEVGEAECYLAGATHPGYNGVGTSTQPDRMTGCQDNIFQNGDLDFDGTDYYPEWPTSLTPGTYAGSFLESFPTSNGAQYSAYDIQTDVALSEQTCGGNTLSTAPPGVQSLAGCTVPPKGPGHFYPYWSFFDQNGSCTMEFGNVSAGATFGKDKQYGSNVFNTDGYPQFISSSHNNPCAT